MLVEANIDALVGPTHHYGGLGLGNLASIGHQGMASSPKRAALECLDKASLVAGLGVPQYLLAPPLRPRLDFLAQLGFRGTVAEQLRSAYEASPRALSAAYSSAFMWAANAATVSPAVDAVDGCGHITPANLISNWHRAFEAQERSEDLRSILKSSAPFAIHAALPNVVPLRDEGAANHMRLCDPSGRIGFNVFVYGEDALASGGASTFMARQTRAACETLARLHCLRPERTFFLQQNPNAISAGVFHNDVIATSHGSLLMHHELAFSNAAAELERLERIFRATTGEDLVRVEVSNAEMSIGDAVSSYFFNSQIVSVADATVPGGMLLICPAECQEQVSAQRLVKKLIDDPLVPITQVHFVSLAQSMAGGGGPACLRLRLPVEASHLAGLNSSYRLTPGLAKRLAISIDRYYPDRVEFADLANPDFAAAAWQAMRQIINCLTPEIYPSTTHRELM